MKLSYKFYRLVLICVLISGIENTSGQNNTNSPYSIFGIGELQHSGFGFTQALGGTGIGIRSNEFLNLENPASLSAIDSTSMHFDFGFHVQYSSIRDENQKESFFNGNISYLAAGIPVGKKWAIGFSVIPLSNIGYQIYTSNIVEGTTQPYSIEVLGTGGLSQINLVNSFELFPSLSIGFNLGYTFGSLDVARTILFGDESLIIEEKQSYHGWNTDFGIQYSHRLGQNAMVTMGAKYRPSINLDGTTTYDIFVESDTISEKGQPLEFLQLPPMAGGGVSVNVKNNFIWAADFSRTFWSNSSEDYRDNTIISSGIAWTPDKDNKRSYLKNISYRIGGRYESGYLTISNLSVNTYSGSVGLGLPFKNSKNRINLSFEVGRHGTVENLLIREMDYRISLSLNLQDTWFIKYKYD